MTAQSISDHHSPAHNEGQQRLVYSVTRTCGVIRFALGELVVEFKE